MPRQLCAGLAHAQVGDTGYQRVAGGLGAPRFVADRGGVIKSRRFPRASGVERRNQVRPRLDQ
jgi:hypothetical protein